MRKFTLVVAATITGLATTIAGFTITSSSFVQTTRIAHREAVTSSLFMKYNYPASLTSFITHKKEDVDCETTWQEDLQVQLKALKRYTHINREFKKQLLESLNVARRTAKNELNPKLYDAFNLDVNGWPTTLKGYYTYLSWFSSYVPQQQAYDGWLDGSSQDYDSTHQEVYDQLCHFYYLINQKIDTKDKQTVTVQDNEWFAQWLVKYAMVWGKFCDSAESISPETIYSFYELSKKYNITDSMIPWNEEDQISTKKGKYTIYNEEGIPLRPNSPSGWQTWNQLFARELNPGLRPIDSPTDNSIICSPADCTYRATYPIGEDNHIRSNDDCNEKVTTRIKRTHDIGNIANLLDKSQYGNTFIKGTFVHYFLGPYSYHRFHAPVAGVVKECFPVSGLAFLNVKITDGQFDAPDDSEDGYEFAQARGIITIDTSNSPYGDIGIVTIIPVGMSQVSSVSMIATEGSCLQKGDEFGFFQFGGSDIIMLFQEGVVPPKNIIGGELYNHYGMHVATAMKK